MNTADFFAALQQQLLDEGNKLMQLAATGSTSEPTAFNGNQLGLVGSGADGSDTEIFSVTTDQINATSGGSINISNVTKSDGMPKQVVINVTGDTAVFSNGSIMYNGQPLASNKELAATITWNMPETVAIKSSGFAQVGTIVAPQATFYMSNGSIDAAKLVVYKYNTTDVNEITKIAAQFKVLNSEEEIHDAINYVVAKGDVTNVGPIAMDAQTYKLVGYSLNGGDMQPLDVVTTIPVAYRSTDQNITFYYQLVRKTGKGMTVSALGNGQKYYEVTTSADKVEDIKQQLETKIAKDQEDGTAAAAVITVVDTEAPSVTIPEYDVANGQKYYEVTMTTDQVEDTKGQLGVLITKDQKEGITSTATITLVDTEAPSVTLPEYDVANGQKHYEVTTTADQVEDTKNQLGVLITKDQKNGIASTATITLVDSEAPSVILPEYDVANGQKHYEVTTTADQVEDTKGQLEVLITKDQKEGITSTATITLVDSEAPSVTIPEYDVANGQKHYEVTTTADQVEDTKNQLGVLITKDQKNGITSTATITVVDTEAPSVTLPEYKLANGQKHYEVTTTVDQVTEVKQQLATQISKDAVIGISTSANISLVDSNAVSTEHKLESVKYLV